MIVHCSNYFFRLLSFNICRIRKSKPSIKDFLVRSWFITWFILFNEKLLIKTERPSNKNVTLNLSLLLLPFKTARFALLVKNKYLVLLMLVQTEVTLKTVQKSHSQLRRERSTCLSTFLLVANALVYIETTFTWRKVDEHVECSRQSS